MPSKKSRRKAREQRALTEVPLDTPDDFEMIEPYPPPRMVCDACIQTDPPPPPQPPPPRAPQPTTKAAAAAAVAPPCVVS